MHGILFKSLKDFLIATYGKEMWLEICTAAGLDEHIFLTIDTYPDRKLLSIIDAAANQTGTAVPDLLEAYGQFTADRFFSNYSTIINDEWDALDLLANAEDQIHTQLRAQNPNLNPPELDCHRDSDTQVTLVYRSERQLCFVAKGIIRGVSEQYGVDLTITEESCMHAGAECCTLVVQR